MSAATTDRPTGSLRPDRSIPRVAAVVAVAVAVVAASVLLGYRIAASATPSDDSPEAGFARDMQTHHNQAVQMSFIIRGKTTDPALQTLTFDIITTQQHQSGQMFAWLTQWGLSQTSSQPPMAWMRAGEHDPDETSGHGLAPGQTSRMPGMASDAEIAKLKDASDEAAEVLFLELMIEHHEAGVTMAEAIQTRTDRPEVLTLADAMATAQASEITQMNRLLRARSG